MEKATLIVREVKNKKIVAELKFANGKILPFPQLSLKDTTLNGAEVEVEREMGRVIRVIVGGKVIFPATMPQPTPKPQAHIKETPRPRPAARSEEPTRQTPRQTFSATGWQHDHISHVRNPAYAPYNFIPLNQAVVAINPTIPDSNKYDAARNTGWIELEIEAVTPLFIRGTLREEEIKVGTQSKDKPDFFSPADQIRIPGSSLRGMARNIVEMVSFGKFEFFENRRLYYRGLADRSNLRDEYQGRMSSYDSRNKRSIYKFSVGVLRKRVTKDRGLHFEIKSSGSNFQQIPKAEAEDRVREIGEKYEEFNFYELAEGYLVVSGNMPNKKRDWLIARPAADAEVFSIPEEDVWNYNNDRTRDDRVPNLLEIARSGKNDRTRDERVPNLLEMARNGKEVPCFYVRWRDEQGEERVSFGHTGMFRLAYEKTIAEHVTTENYRIDDNVLEKLKDEIATAEIEKLRSLASKEYAKSQLLHELKNRKFDKKQINAILQTGAKIDFAEAIFGHEKTHAGRVFFEDVFLMEEQNEVLLGEQTPQILSAPKPTTFQHYLAQGSDEVRNLNHYNSNASLRGHKFYWHKSGEQWRERDQKAIQEHRTQYTMINPVKPGAKFHGQIRFENLSDKELGALLFSLHLPEGCCHKLGMGKPLGLGSIRLTPKLYLSDRQARYQDFFAEWDNDIAESDKLQELKKAFENYVLDKLKADGKTSLWETERLRELLVMLQYNVGKQLEANGRIRYMSIGGQNEFKNRPVLSKPSGLVSPAAVDEMIAKVKNEIAQPRQKVTRIEKIEINGLWDKVNISWKLDPKVNILVGINGSGKTTILELIAHALKEEYQSVRYAPKEFTITFDKNAQNRYPRESPAAKSDYHLSARFISTFDKEILGRGDKESVAKYINRQLSDDLYSCLSDFSIQRESLSKTIDPQPYINEFIDIANEAFKRTEKRVELVGNFQITDAVLNQLKPEKEFPEDFHKKLEEMKVGFKLIGSWKEKLQAEEKNLRRPLLSDSLEKKLQGIQDVKFNTKKELENAIEKVFKEFKVDALIVPSLVERVNIYKPDAEFLKILESKINQDTAARFISLVLKHVEFLPDPAPGYLVFRLNDGRRLIPDQLSAGEKQLLIILLTALISKFGSLLNGGEPSVFIMDEPEVSLHVEWQEKLIHWIKRLNDQAQIVISTHSAGMMMGGWFDKVTKVEEIATFEEH